MKIIARYKYTKGYSDVYPLEYVYYITATDGRNNGNNNIHE